MSKVEIPKRLAPTPAALRQLYALSGNECAFPGCEARLMNSLGDFVGQVCHVEAAMPDGERFNPSMTNEQRRHASNLLLMCYPHHVETNDVTNYAVARMTEIKRGHEARFANVIAKIAASMSDKTKTVQPTIARTLLRLDRDLGWKLSEGDRMLSVEELRVYVERLKIVPLESRELLAVVVERAREDSGARVLYDDIVHAVRDESAVRTHVEILESHSILWVDYGEGYSARIVIPPLKSGWPLWPDLRLFCEKNKLSVSDFTVRLRFNLLDA